MAEVLAEDRGHTETLSEQRDGGLEKLSPRQAAVSAVGLSIATELPRNPDPLGPCAIRILPQPGTTLLPQLARPASEAHA